MGHHQAQNNPPCNGSQPALCCQTGIEYLAGTDRMKSSWHMCLLGMLLGRTRHPNRLYQADMAPTTHLRGLAGSTNPQAPDTVFLWRRTLSIHMLIHSTPDNTHSLTAGHIDRCHYKSSSSCMRSELESDSMFYLTRVQVS